MKSIKYLYMGLVMLALVACEQFDNLKDTEKIESISASVKINVAVEEGIPTPSAYQVKFNNYEEGFELIKEADASGVLDTDNLIPGIYTVTVSAEVSHNGFTYNFNGNIVNENISLDGKKLEIDVKSSRSGDLLFKELYYVGCKTANNKTYITDQYYEIYNNGNSVQYLDNLCIGTMLPLNATANMPVWPDEYKDDHVFFGVIWQIRGTGTEYPLAPGESVIIAAIADNHQREELNPLSPVNLLGAEFEAYVNSVAFTKDNPAKNMELKFGSAPKQWTAPVNGGAYAIFYPDKEIDKNTYVTPVGQTTKAKEIKMNNIIDAVELVKNSETMKLKRVPAVLDAGASTVGGTNNKKSVSRKIKEVKEDGRIIYMDTNNSTEDFQVNDFPVIRRDGVKAPSWNTWLNQNN